MPPPLTVACIFLKSAWQAFSLRSALFALLLAPIVAVQATETTAKETDAPLTTAAPSAVTAAVSHRLSNEKIGVGIADGGGLAAVENILAAETYAFSGDFFIVETDLGEFSNRTAKPASVKADAQQVEFRYEFDAGEISLVYALKPDNAFCRRWLTIRNTRGLRLKKVTLGSTKFAQPARDVLHYVTFIAAPTVEFVRHEKGGWFTGIENPFFKSTLGQGGVTLSYEPGLILKAGEGYTSEPQFLGVYRNSGVMVADSGRNFRYNANGSGYKPLDRNEMREMRAFALDYLAPVQKHFLNINYQFFHPLPQMPHTDQQKDYYPTRLTPSPKSAVTWLSSRRCIATRSRMRASLSGTSCPMIRIKSRGKSATMRAPRASVTVSTWAARRTAAKAMPPG